MFLILFFGFLFFQESSAQTSNVNDSITSVPIGKIYTMPELETSFPGGEFARNKYFYNIIENNRKVLNLEGAQFCYLKFVVDKEGNISDITTRNAVENKLDEVVIKALKAGPKWIPARSNGHKVNAYTTLTFIFEPNGSRNRTYSRNFVRYFVTKENKRERDVKKLLVLMAGTVPARIFTDNLYENLKTDLKNNDVETDFLFLGNDRKSALDNFNRVSNSKDFDAILLLMQDGKAIIDERGPVYLKQDMSIFVLDPEDLENSIIEGKIFMNFQLLKKSAYEKASKDLLNILQQNRVISSGN